jgi:hypothetical protein
MLQLRWLFDTYNRVGVINTQSPPSSIKWSAVDNGLALFENLPLVIILHTYARYYVHINSPSDMATWSATGSGLARLQDLPGDIFKPSMYIFLFRLAYLALSHV